MNVSPMDTQGRQKNSQGNDRSSAAPSTIAELTQTFMMESSQTGPKEDRIQRLESLMEKMIHRVAKLGQKSTGSIKDNTLGKACTSCIQVYHNIKNNCSNRWVIPFDQIGKCRNDVPISGIESPFVSAGRPTIPSTQDRVKKLPSRTRLTNVGNSSLSVPAILFPSCASQEKKRYVSYPNDYHRKSEGSNMSSQESNSESGTCPGSWIPTESDPLSILMQDESPTPSGTKPTFVAMIKTAIRDLKRYRRTSVEAISKYILLRYQIQNDILLQYLLDWMTDMDILEKRENNYVFSSKRLVKKTTVAVIRNRNRSRSSRRRKKSSKHRSRSRRTNRSRDRYNQKRRRRYAQQKKKQACTYESVDYSDVPKRQRRRRKCRKQGKRIKVTVRKPCTCRHELRAAKNRVKVKSRYVRRGGKIYKEEEYI